MNTETPKDLNALAARIHQIHIKWWQDLNGNPITRDRGEVCMLVVTELAEAMEGERKNLMDDHLPHRKMAEVEMADAYIRLMDMAGGFGITLGNWHSTGNWSNKGDALLRITREVCQCKESEESVNIAMSLILAYCHRFGYDLYAAIEEKLEFNQKRYDHTHEARAMANGKKF